YCASCHQLPEAGDLDQTTWQESVLPRMRYFVGLDQVDPQYPPDWWEAGAGGEMVQKARIFPQEALMSEEQWDILEEYFLSQAAVKLPKPKLDLSDSLSLFTANILAFRPASPATTYLQIRPEGGLAFGEANTQRLYLLDQKLEVQQAANTREGLVHLHESPAAYYLTVMGQFSPTDASEGFIMALSKQAGQAKVILPNLQRPVHTEYADLDGDGLQDLLVSEFGKWTGGLSWWKGKADGSFEDRPLRPVSGAIQAFARDLNGDDRLDVIALFGQGAEGVFAFWNQGDGTFRSEQLLYFSPSYGSASMQLLDWDQDGRLDILVCNGDNADYPPIVKPYHGLRLWHNQGEGRFAERFSLPLPGAYQAEVADFDEDGDLDIAAISFFRIMRRMIHLALCCLRMRETINLPPKASPD
ncbi:MAG: VCBS repeat-containing protein, partial [Bacteroidota bacterium]